MIRPNLDNNTSTRRPLHEHLDTRIFVIDDILQVNKVRLVGKENRNEVIEEFDVSAIRKI